MSAVGETRQHWGWTALRAAAWPARLLRGLVYLVLLIAGLLAASAGILAWRLSQGPLDVAWLARKIEAAVNGEDSPTRLHIGEASIAWPGFQEGAGKGIALRLQDVRVVNRSGAPGAELKEADVVLSLGRLLELQVVPRSVSVIGLRLRAVRAEDGSVTLDLGTLTQGDAGATEVTTPEPSPTMADTMAELRRPASNDRGRSVPGLAQLAQLRRVQVHDAAVTVVDQGFAATVTVTVSALDLLRQANGGVKGVADGQLGLGDATASVHLQADLAAGGGTRLQLALAPLQSTALARANPALAGLSVLDTALQGTATVDLAADLRPQSLAVQASAGPGRAAVRGGALAFNGLALDATAAWPTARAAGSRLVPDHVQLSRLQALLPGPSGAVSTLAASGTAAHQGGKLTGRLDVTLDHMLFADLPSVWPAAWGGNVRPWLVQNVTGGTAHDGAVHLVLDAPESDPAQVQLDEAGGSLLADDVTIWWLRPVPPIEHAQAVLKVIGPDEIDIAVPSGRQGPIALTNGLIKFTGLSAKDQVMNLVTDLTGPVADVWTLLKHPRLHLMDKRPIKINNPAGTLGGKLTVVMPLKKELSFDQVKIGAQGKLAALHLGGIVAGRDIDKGDIQFDVNQDGLKASGNAAVAGVASAIGVEMDFRPGPPDQILQHATMSGRATVAQLAAAGIDPGGLLTTGAIGLDAAYSARRDGQSQIGLKADLKDAGVALVGWRKPPGPAAEAAATVLLKNEKLAGITGLQAQGPGMRIVGRADMVGDKPSLLHLDQIELGPTRASGEIRFPADTGGPIHANLSGSVLDLSTQLSGTKPAARSPPRAGQGSKEQGSAWIADIRFDRVLLARQRSIGGVTAHAEDDGKRLTVLRADSTGPERVQAVIAPEGNGRRVSVRAADGGAVLRALDILETVQGGRLALEGHYDDRYPDPPLAGTLDMSDFEIKDAVSAGKLLQALSVYGIADALRGSGLQFARLLMPFRYSNDVLDIGESRAFSSSLGITAEGRIDIGRKALEMHGTIVPAYAVNSALGRIPLIGRLFSSEKDGGLVSVNYSVTGSLSNPSVTVNPLSALTPGFLRGLFKMF